MALIVRITSMILVHGGTEEILPKLLNYGHPQMRPLYDYEMLLIKTIAKFNIAVKLKRKMKTHLY